ncbi:DUF3747 domain-containing protein [Vulcanococcus limneticus]|uniref:DUF3747 domain-containing protein n=1 Tax=Vulcanococcus limneticus TaxID=2170428 RepID=UPI00398BFD02
MQRTYLPWLGLSALAAGTALTLQDRGVAAALFDSRAIDSARFAVLARPVGRSDWNLLVLEQIAATPRCWEPRADGLIDPALNRFDYTGICSRYLDSNGYSLRVGQQDLGTTYRLRLSQQGSTLQLLAMTPENPTELLVGRGTVNLRDRDGFVGLTLEPGWELQRRVYGRQTLNHVYFANATPLGQLIAASSGSDGSNGDGRPGDGRFGASRRAGLGPATAPGLPGAGDFSDRALASGPVPLQVIPFRE